MAERRRRKQLIEPRLLQQAEAAAYCGVCPSVFKEACPVKPVLLLDRIPRYDRNALDEWIDRLNPSSSEDPFNLTGMWDARNECKSTRP